MKRAQWIITLLAGVLLLAAGPARADFIDPGPPVSLDFLAPDLGTITDLNLQIEESGPFASAISITLSHLGISVLVYDANTDSVGAMDAIFDDESLGGPAPKNGNIIGSFLPDNPLSAFDGLALGGIWSLTFDDFTEIEDGDELLTSSIFGTVQDDTGQIVDFLVQGPGNALPEPGSLALLGMGLIGAGMWRRRRR